MSMGDLWPTLPVMRAGCAIPSMQHHANLQKAAFEEAFEPSKPTLAVNVTKLLLCHVTE